ISSLREQLAEREKPMDALVNRVVAMCRKRNWSLHWTHRGAYLHLESSELIEAIRGKHGDKVEEAADVLNVWLSIIGGAGIPFAEVMAALDKKLTHLETAPSYEGEQRDEPTPTPPRTYKPGDLVLLRNGEKPPPAEGEKAPPVNYVWFRETKPHKHGKG